MKNFYFAITFILLSTICSCKSTSETENYVTDTTGIPTMEGRAYLQPLEKITALSFASTKTTVFFDFLDSTYCNVEINSAVGNAVQSRKYKIDSKRVFTLINPLNEKKVPFNLVINNDTTIYLKKNGVNYYKLIPYSNEVNGLFLSQNQLKIQKFLYPTLTEKEREFGAENQYIQTESGKMVVKSNPLRTDVSKINVYKLF